jgi:hypothetical protein
MRKEARPGPFPARRPLRWGHLGCSAAIVPFQGHSVRVGLDEMNDHLTETPGTACATLRNPRMPAPWRQHALSGVGAGAAAPDPIPGRAAISGATRRSPAMQNDRIWAPPHLRHRAAAGIQIEASGALLDALSRCVQVGCGLGRPSSCVRRRGSPEMRPGRHRCRGARSPGLLTRPWGPLLPSHSDRHRMLRRGILGREWGAELPAGCKGAGQRGK